MHVDYSDVNDALERMKSLADSLSLISEGKVVEYEGRQFQELTPEEGGLTSWVASFWSTPEPKTQESEQIEQALDDLSRSITLVKGYLESPGVRNVEKIRSDIITIKTQCETLNIDPGKYDESTLSAIGQLISQFDQLEYLLGSTFDAEYRATFISVDNLISDLNEAPEMPPVTIDTEGLNDELLAIVIEGQKDYEWERTKKQIDRDIKLGALARMIEEGDDIIDGLKSEEDRDIVRQKIAASERGDVVCQLSQGRVDEKGQAACAFISLTGAYHVLKGDDFTSEKEIYQVIREGIGTYGRRTGNQPVQEAVLAINKKYDEGVAPYIPEGFEEAVTLNEIETIILSMMRENPQEYPFQRQASEGFAELLSLLERESAEGSRVGVINCMTKDATEVKFVYPREGKFYLFDSHGKPYHGESLGASVLSFDTLEECNAKLLEELGGDEANIYDFWFLNLSG